MKVKNLSFLNLRSFTYLAKLGLSPEINIISGLNGAGKSTILEALTYCFTGELSEYEVSKNTPSPFIVSSELTFTTGERFCIETEATRGKVNTSLKTVKKESELEIPSGVVTYLLICSVENMYWMFEKPVEIYHIANEILSFERYASFSSSMLTEGNRMSKTDQNLSEIVELQQKMRKIRRLSEVGKEGHAYTLKCIEVFEQCQALFEKGAMIIIVEPEAADFDLLEGLDQAENAVEEGRKQIINLEVELEQKQSQRVSKTNLEYDQSKCDSIINFVNNAFTDIDLQDDELLGEVQEYKEASDYKVKLVLCKQLFLEYQEKYDELNNAIRSEQEQCYQLKEKVLNSEAEVIKLSKLENDVEENEKRASDYNAEEEQERELELEFEGLEVAIENRELQVDNLESQISEYDQCVELVQELSSQVANIKAIYDEHSDELNDPEVRDLDEVEARNKLQELRNFKSSLSKYQFSSGNDYFSKCNELLHKDVKLIDEVALGATNLLISKDLIEEFKVIREQLIDFANQKQKSVEFIAELCELLNHYAIQLQDLSNDEELLSDLEEIIQFAKLYEYASETLKFEDGENYNNKIDDLIVQYNNQLEFIESITQEALLPNENDSHIVSKMGDCFPELKEVAIFYAENNDYLCKLKYKVTPICPPFLDMAISGEENDKIHGLQKEMNILLQKIADDEEVSKELLRKIAEGRKIIEEHQEAANCIKSQRGSAGEVSSSQEIEKEIIELKAQILSLEEEIDECELQEQCSTERLDELSESGIHNYEKIPMLIREIELLLEQKQYDREETEIQILNSELEDTFAANEVNELKLGQLLRLKEQYEEYEDNIKKQEGLKKIESELRIQLLLLTKDLDALIEFHRANEALLSLEFSKKIEHCSNEIKEFKQPFSNYKQVFEQINDYLIQIEENFLFNLDLKKQESEVSKLLKKQITVYSDSTASQLIGEELKIASSSLKKAIETFEDECFQKANVHFSSFWKEVYNRKDIEDVRISLSAVRSTLEIQGLIDGQWRPLENMISAGEKALCSILFRISLLLALELPVKLFCSDEPTNFLDEGNEEELAKVLAEFEKESNIEFIIVTHSEKFAEMLVSESGGMANEIRVVNKSGSRIELERV